MLELLWPAVSGPRPDFTCAPESDHIKFAIMYVAASPLVSQATRESPVGPANMPETITMLRWARCSPPEAKGAGVEYQYHGQERSHAVDRPMAGSRARGISVEPLLVVAVVCGHCLEAGDLAGAPARGSDERPPGDAT